MFEFALAVSVGALSHEGLLLLWIIQDCCACIRLTLVTLINTCGIQFLKILFVNSPCMCQHNCFSLQLNQTAIEEVTQAHYLVLFLSHATCLFVHCKTLTTFGMPEPSTFA